MMIVRFKNGMEHEELLKKVKKMKQFTEDIEMCLEDALEDEEPSYRGSSYRHHDEDEEDFRMGGRYSYRRGMR